MASISGTANNDSLLGSTEADVINALAGDDTLTSIGNWDTVYGGDGNDRLYSVVDPEFVFNPAATFVSGGHGDDWLIFDNMDQVTLSGGTGKDLLYLWSSGGAHIDGGADDDTINATISWAASTIRGGSGDDNIAVAASAAASPLLVDGGDGSDRISVGTAASRIYGGTGDDVIIARDGGKKINAGEGNDTIVCTRDFRAPKQERGTSWVRTGHGRDVVALHADLTVAISDFQAGAGGDRLDLDQLINQRGELNANTRDPLLEGWLRLRAVGDDTYVQVLQDGTWLTAAILRDVRPAQLTRDNFLQGIDPARSPAALALQGGTAADDLRGGVHNDTLRGLDGDDLLDGAYGGHDWLDGGAGNDSLVGMSGNDTLLGGAGIDEIQGHTGNDVIRAGDGDDGSNKLYYSLSEPNWTHRYVFKETGINGGAGNDSIDGGAGNDVLNGGAGRDLVYGNSGNDSITDHSYDTLLGGAGNDSLTLLAPEQPYLQGGAVIDGGDDNDQLKINFSGLATVRGGSGDDSLRNLAQYANRQLLHGGEGNDTLYVASGYRSTVLGGDGSDLIQSMGTSQYVSGGAGNDAIHVQGFNNTVNGGAGDDLINMSWVIYGFYSYESPAQVRGGSGRDTIVLPPLTSVGPVQLVDFTTGNAGDILDLQPLLARMQERGMKADADPFAEGWLRMTSCNGGLMLEADMDGSGQDGSFAAIAHFLHISDISQFSSSNFLPPLQPRLSSNAAAPEVEWIRVLEFLEDSRGPLGITPPSDPDGGPLTISVAGLPHPSTAQILLADGSAIHEGQVLTAEQLAGLQVQLTHNYDRDDVAFLYQVSDDEGSVRFGQVAVHVQAVNDAPIIRTLGNKTYSDGHTFGTSLLGHVYEPDRLDPELHLHYELTMADGSPLPDWLNVDKPYSPWGYVPVGFTDTLRLRLTVSDGEAPPVSEEFTLRLGGHIERAFDRNSTLLGGSGNDSLYGAFSYDSLQGFAGNDILSGGGDNDTLDGGSGRDTMTGGDGNDYFHVDQADDQTRELSSQGDDTVAARIDWTLSAHTENLTLIGAARVGIGNSLHNRLAGNDRGNRLQGGSGNDSLTGHGGNDSLYGGSGNDRYQFGRGDGADRITENDTVSGNSDVAAFDTGITSSQLWFRQVGNDLQISIIGTSDRLTVGGWYLGSAYRVEQFQTADGQVLLAADVAKLVNAMASLTPPAAGQTTLPASYQTELNPVIAASWN